MSTDEASVGDDVPKSVYERLDTLEEELEAEREARQELSQQLQECQDVLSIFDFRTRVETDNGTTELQDADPTDPNTSVENLYLFNVPVGELINENRRDTRTLRKITRRIAGVTENEVRQQIANPDDETRNDLQLLLAYIDEEDLGLGATGDGDAPTDQIRDGVREAHRWMLDLDVNNCADRSDTQGRVARIFRRFVRKAAGETDTGVDASGQTYSVTTSAATDILDDEDALSGVKKRSKSTIVARVMRETQQATLDVDCQCESVDECAHALLTFKPGKPHTLAVQKKDLEEYMAEYTDRLAQDTDDGVKASEAPADVETSEAENAADDLAEESERVFSAEVAQDD